jgi:general secretion pathway protein E
VGAVTRLRDMGVEPFLLASTLLGVVAQRLVRVLNPDTRIGYPPGEYESRLLGLTPADAGRATIFRPGADSGNGYRGRTGIYELVIINDRMRVMIHDGAGEHELEREARQVTLGIRDDGRAKVLSGATSLEELFRVAREE